MGEDLPVGVSGEEKRSVCDSGATPHMGCWVQFGKMKKFWMDDGSGWTAEYTCTFFEIIFIYLFGCVESLLRHAGSSLQACWLLCVCLV